jgi:hypothetical protein
MSEDCSWFSHGLACRIRSAKGVKSFYNFIVGMAGRYLFKKISFTLNFLFDRINL